MELRGGQGPRRDRQESGLRYCFQRLRAPRLEGRPSIHHQERQNRPHCNSQGTSAQASQEPDRQSASKKETGLVNIVVQPAALDTLLDRAAFVLEPLGGNNLLGLNPLWSHLALFIWPAHDKRSD